MAKTSRRVTWSNALLLTTWVSSLPGVRGEVIRYAGVIGPKGECAARLKSYPRSHVFAGTTGSDNIVAFKTQRYHPQSLFVQGPGAGPDAHQAEYLQICLGLLLTWEDRAWRKLTLLQGVALCWPKP